MYTPDDHVLQYVDAYLHDVLHPSEKRQVAEHCEVCPICRVALDEARKRLEVLESLPPVEASEALIAATRKRIQQYRPSRFTPLRVGLAAAAAVVALLAGFHLYYLNMAASPYDLRVLGQSELWSGSEASLRVLFQDARNAAPLTGAPVEIQLLAAGGKPAVHLATFTTDRFGSGSFHMRLPDWSPGKYQLRVSARAGGVEQTVDETVTLRRSWQAMLTSDKPVYQPGDVIHLRSLTLAQPQRKPVAGQEIVFSVSDPKGNVVFRQRDVTSRFGIAALDCPLATEIIEGAYQIRCELGDTTSALAVQVEKYVLPKFKLTVDLDEPYYAPGQKVRGTVTARYFFGKAVGRGKVQIEADSTDFLARKLVDVTTQTDAAGVARFEFVLPPSLIGRPQDAGEARISLTATVHDSAGQAQTAGVSRIVTEQPVHIEVIPESGQLVPGVANRVYFLTTYADGRPAATRIVVSGLPDELQTNPLGAAVLEFTPQSDECHWLVRASDAAGKTGRHEVTLRADSADGQFLVRTDKAVYDGGQTVHVSVLGGGNEPVFVDLIKDGQTMLTDTIPVTDGRGEYVLDLPPELSGTIQLVASRLGRGGLPITENRVIYVRPADGLKLTAKLDRAEYRPGQSAKLSVAVTDAQGKPVPAAVSLAAVDEAVYSVLGHNAGVASPLSSFEEKLLKPVYAIYDWSPDSELSASVADRDRFEQALFATAGQNKTDRDAILKEAIRRFGDNDQRLLDVLNRPDWEQLAESMPDLQKYIPLLRGEGSTYSLRDSSYREASRRIELLRAERLSLMDELWFGLGAAIGLSVVAWLLVLASRNNVLAAVLVTVFVIGVLISLLMPAVQSARESARRTQAQNDMRQLGMALDAGAAKAIAVFDPQKNDKGKESIAAADSAGIGPNGEPPRVRQWFPETLLWRPELITDENGRADMNIDLADSITTWRLSSSAVSSAGQLGGGQQAIRVFQPFFVDLNLPVALTRGDEIAIPAVVYNYLDKPLTVELQLADAPWLERLDGAERNLELAPGEVRSISYRFKARQVGRHELMVHAAGGGAADAIKRTIDVLPDGRRVEQTASGSLQQPADIAWSVPGDAIEGSVKATVKIFPSTFSEVVDGLEGIFQQPYGCFEQTSSTTYPNVLALDYLRRTHKSVPQVEAEARQYIALGYQRLLGFEVPGGGFDWFGRTPASRTLTAYGLMEFSDMARVSEVDPQLIERTRRWLLDQQNADGSWSPDRNATFHEDPTRGAADLEQLSTTAYIGWAVFAGGGGDQSKAGATVDYLLRREPATIDDPYVLALVANALLAIQPNSRDAEPYLARLETLCRRSDDGKLAWWDQEGDRRTMFYGAGRSGNIETTAMAALAMLHDGAHSGTVRAALGWLVAQKDAGGTWYSTQATVLALRALLAGTDQPLADAQPRQIDIQLDGHTVKSLPIPVDQSDVVQQVDLSRGVLGGGHRLAIIEHTSTAAGYQATLVYHMPGADRPPAAEPLSIQLDYDKTSLTVDDRVNVTATVANHLPATAPMIILDLPIPPGFALESEDFESLKSSEKIAKYQLTARSAIVYLRELRPGEPLAIHYHLRATMPIKITAPAARAYEYYNPDHHAATTPTAITVAAAK